MKRVVAAVLTVVLMFLLVWAGARRELAVPAIARPDPVVSQPGTFAPAAHPAEARVQALLESARSGDVVAYLDAFTGNLRKRLDREVAERGREAFAADLTRASGLRKSHAVFSAEPEDEAAALVTVESVYPDLNERQTYRVEKLGETWLVTAVETVRSIQPRAKFGSLATFEAPEGVPVQGTGATGEEPDPTTGQVPR